MPITYQADNLLDSIGVNVPVANYGTAIAWTLTADAHNGDTVLNVNQTIQVTATWMVTGSPFLINGTTVLSFTSNTVTLKNHPVTGGTIPAGTLIVFIDGNSTLLTNADTPNGNVLPFAAVGLVELGNQVMGPNIPLGATVTAIDTVAHKVTLSLNVAGDVPSGTKIGFIDTAGYDSPNWENVVLPQLAISGMRWLRTAVSAFSGDSASHKALYFYRVAQVGQLGPKWSVYERGNTDFLVGSIAPQTVTFTGSMSGTTTLTVIGSVTGPASGIVVGTIITGTGGNQVAQQLTGTAGQAGTYRMSLSQTIVSQTLTGTYGLLTVSLTNASTPSPHIQVGYLLYEYVNNSVIPGTTITQTGTGTGDNGTYYVSPSQTTASGSQIVFTPFSTVFTANYLASGGWGIIEGVNEPTISGLSSVANAVHTYTEALWNYIQADPVLGPAGINVTVVGPGVTAPTTAWANMGDLTPFITWGNMHPYSGGAPDTTNIANYLAFARPLPYGTLPVLVSEVGYNDKLSDTGSHPVSDTVIARYTPRLYLSHFLQGIPKSYVYQMIKNKPVGVGSASDQYGLINYDGSIQYVSAYDGQLASPWNCLLNLMNLFRDPGVPFTTNPLAYSVTGGDSTVTFASFQKRNGVYLFPIWVAQDGWSQTTHMPITVSPQTVTVNLPSSIGSVTVYTFNDDGTLSSGTQPLTNGVLLLTIDDHLRVLSWQGSLPSAPGPQTQWCED